MALAAKDTWWCFMRVSQSSVATSVNLFIPEIPTNHSDLLQYVARKTRHLQKSNRSVSSGPIRTKKLQEDL